MIGYNGLFLGNNFFVEEDPLNAYTLTHGNAKGNGWRPDVGYGMSFFQGDPGTIHPWGLWSLWERVFQTKYLSYNLSIIILLILASLSVYLFLCRISPALNKSTIIFAVLSPLIAFSPAQHEFYFNRHWITLAIGTPLILILLHSYFKAPRIVHLFQASFIFWFVWFLGSFVSFFQLFILCLFFSVLYYAYYHPIAKDYLKNIAFLCLAVSISLILLGAWCFYPIFLELKTVDYIRDPIYKIPSNELFLGVKELWLQILQKLHAGWLPDDIAFLSLPETLQKFGLRTISWENCFASFPLIFLFFLSKKSFSFWEYILFWLIVIFYSHSLLMTLSPFYYNFLCKYIFGYPLIKFQPVYHCFQLGMLALFLSRYKSYLFYNKNWSSYLRSTLAVIISSAYISLVFFSIAIYFIPSTMKGVFADVDLLQLRKSVNFSIIAFYLSSAFIIGIFVKDKWLHNLLGKYPTLIAILFLMNGILLSWSVYPLNSRPLIWDVHAQETSNLNYGPTSRFFWAHPSGINCEFHDYKWRWGVDENEPVKKGIGYRDVPGFSVNAVKNFTQREIRDYILDMIIKGVNNPPHQTIRDISCGAYYNKHSAIAFDISAISHVFTIGKCDVPETLIILNKTIIRNSYFNNLSDLYVYKNRNAWPYFYLAEWGIVEGEVNLFKPKQQDASFIKLRDFSYGEITFDYNGASKNTLIVADAWHPFWKAYVDEVEMPVFKANGIFKGVILPNGKHSVVMAFDISPYYPGIYVSIIAWILFLFSWLYFYIHRSTFKGHFN